MLVKQLLLFLVLVSVFLSLVYSKPTKKYRYDAEFLDSEIQRIRSGRADQVEPVWSNNKKSQSDKYPGMESHSKDKDGKERSRGDTEDSDENDPENSGSNSTEDEDYYTSSEEIEITCAPDKGWHIRGQRCVPLNCPGGPAERDFNTGECLYSSQPKGRYQSFQRWNDLNHVYRSSPMSTHFVRSMILMRKG